MEASPKGGWKPLKGEKMLDEARVMPGYHKEKAEGPSDEKL